MEKIWLFTQESNVDGEILFNVIPCTTEERAREIMEEEIETLNSESHHFKGFEDDDEYFEIERDENHFYINDNSDDYYEDWWIYEKEIEK